MADGAPLWYFTHIPKAGGTVVADVLKQCLARVPNARPPCALGMGSTYDHVCERPPSVVNLTRASVAAWATGGEACSFVETHHDHTLLQHARAAAHAVARAGRSPDRQRTHQLRRAMPDEGTAQRITSFVVLRLPVERTLSAWYMPRAGRTGALANSMALAGRAGSAGRHATGDAAHHRGAENASAAQVARIAGAFDVRKSTYGQKYGYEPDHVSRQLGGVLEVCSIHRLGIRSAYIHRARTFPRDRRPSPQRCVQPVPTPIDVRSLPTAPTYSRRRLRILPRTRTCSYTRTWPTCRSTSRRPSAATT